jgi:two-component system LytT family response regulator/two-component system response regulator AlgR
MPEALKVVVAEDEPFNRKRLSRLLREAGCEVAAELPDGPAVLEWLEAGGQADALFLDIEMPGASGLEVALDLPRHLPVVFVTAYAEHAVKAFETAALDYLLKPATAERLAVSLQRIRERLERVPAQGARTSQRYPVRAGDGLVLLDLARTSHFAFEEDAVWAYVNGERFRTTWKSLTEVEAAFPALVRGHRHLLIRPEAVVGVKAGEFGRLIVRMQGGNSVEVSRGAAPALKGRLGLREKG